MGVGSASTGLTKYVGAVELSFDSEPKETKTGRKSMLRSLAERGWVDENDSGELTPRSVNGSVSTFGRALTSGLSSFRKHAESEPKDIGLWKPEQDTVLGITFELPEDESLKGVVVSQLHPAHLMARSKKIRVGDVLHAVNGLPVTTPQEGATYLREVTPGKSRTQDLLGSRDLHLHPARLALATALTPGFEWHRVRPRV